MAACSFGWWLMLICSERKVPPTGGWWLVSQTNRVMIDEEAT
jgi:hypothetical protein